MDYIGINIDKFAAKNLINEQKSNFTAFKKLVWGGSYIPFTDSLLEHVLFCNKLSDLKKLLYLTVYSLSFIGLNKTGHRRVAISALKVGKIIGCSKSQVLAMQKSLSEQDYLFIVRQKNKFGQNNRNLLSPLIPSEVFAFLAKAPDKKSVYLPLFFNKGEETPLSYLERTKQYLPLNYQIFKLVASDAALSSKQKILWLTLYAKAYKNSSIINDNSTDDFSFTSTYAEFAKELNLSVGKVSDNLNILVKEGYLQKQRFYVKNGSNIQDRCDKSLWRFTLSMPAQNKKKNKGNRE